MSTPRTEYHPFDGWHDHHSVGLAAHIETTANDWFQAEGEPVTIGRQELNAFLNDVRSLASHVRVSEEWRKHEESASDLG